jgi:hypothetical protein
MWGGGKCDEVQSELDMECVGENVMKYSLNWK